MRNPVLLVLLTLACACAGTKPQSSVSNLGTSVKDEFWDSLNNGDMKAATEILSHSEHAADKLSAQFALAMAMDNSGKVAELLAAGGLGSDKNTLLVAAEAALATGVDDLSALAEITRSCAELPESETSRWKTVCAKYKLAHTTSPILNRCAKGCETEHVFSLGSFQGRPVLMVTLDDGSRAPFLVDTGASSSCLSPQFVDKARAKVVKGTEFEASSSGGMIESRLATANLAIGEMIYEKVALALIDLPIDGFAGIISPHALFAKQTVTLDFRNMEMRVSPTVDSVSTAEMERAPLLMAGGNPHLLVRVGERSPRPVLLDSGADTTRISVELDAMGSPLNRKDEAVSKAAGGEYKSWTTEGEVSLSIGDARWAAGNLIIYEPKGEKEAARVKTFGILGMDFLMGRRLVIDRPNSVVLFDKQVALPPWKIGDKRTLTIMGSHVGKDFDVHEEVVGREGDSVILKVLVDKPDDVRRFKIELKDSWKNRSTWLITRPATAYWKEAGDELVPGKPGDAVQDWLPAFMPFGVDGANAVVSFEELTVDGKASLCSRMNVSANVKKRPARFTIWDCSRNVWRTTRLEVTDAVSGELLWGFKQSN